MGCGSRASFCGRVQVVVRRVRLRSCRRHRIAGANLDRSSDCTFDVVVRRVNKFNCTTLASRSSISVHQLSVSKIWRSHPIYHTDVVLACYASCSQTHYIVPCWLWMALLSWVSPLVCRYIFTPGFSLAANSQRRIARVFK